VVERRRFVKGAQRVGLRLWEIRVLLEVIDRASALRPHRHAAGGRLAEVDAGSIRVNPAVWHGVFA
jgi:hypothetical protein